jgi:hypothetical protein
MDISPHSTLRGEIDLTFLVKSVPMLNSPATKEVFAVSDSPSTCWDHQVLSDYPSGVDDQSRLHWGGRIYCSENQHEGVVP